MSLKNFNIVKKIVTIFFVIIFCFMLLSPLVTMITTTAPPPVPIFENRMISEKPDFKKLPLEQWSNGIETYLADNLGYRSQMISWYMKLWEFVLATNVRYFVKGKKDEFFPNFSKAPTVQSYLGLTSISQKDIRLFQIIAAGTQAFWELNGVNYLMVMAPDKTTLNPELLPPLLSRLPAKSKSMQIDNVLRNSPVNFLNLNLSLKKNKSTANPFNKKFDTVHWNGYGLETAYKEICKAIAKENIPALQPKPRGIHYNIVPKEVQVGIFGRETIPWMEILHTDELKVIPNDFAPDVYLPWQKADLIHNKKRAQGRLLFITDSYFKNTHQNKLPGSSGSIFPLAHHFQAYLHMHCGYLTLTEMRQILKVFKPETVIYAFAERQAPPDMNYYEEYLLMLGDIYLNNTSIILAPAERIEKAIISSNCQITKGKDKVKFTAGKKVAYMQLSPVVSDVTGRVVVIAKLLSPVDTVAQLFFAQREQKFSKSRSIRQSIKKGENYLHLPAYGKPNEPIKLYLLFGVAPKEYQFLPIPELYSIKDLR